MNTENTKYLIEKYPKLFPQESIEEGPQRTLMCFGFECGDGWFNLINSLCAVIQDHIDSKQDPESYNHDPEYFQIEVIQVKEKFGGLRFYTLHHPQDLDKYISTVESMSYHICDVCGTTKDVFQTSGWIQTICKKCHEKTDKNDTIPSADEAEIYAVKVSELVEPKLTAQEQSFFVAGFQECIKWLTSIN